MSKEIKNAEPNPASKPGRLPSPAARQDGKAVVRSLLGDRVENLEAKRNAEALMVDPKKLVPNPDQPRKSIEEDKDEELFQSVQVYGVLEPILVTKLPDGEYQIIAGERRYRAALRANLKEVPVIVKDFDERRAKLVAAIENLQRADLTELDEARYFQYLMDNFNYSGEQIASLIHRSASYVTRRLKKLPSLLQTDVLRETETNGNDGDEFHNNFKMKSLKENSQSLQNRASSNRFVKKFKSFSSVLDEAREQLPDIDPEEKAALNEQLDELQARIAELRALLEK
jgi:ParB family chromosome partitioning protein